MRVPRRAAPWTPGCADRGSRPPSRCAVECADSAGKRGRVGGRWSAILVLAGAFGPPREFGPTALPPFRNPGNETPPEPLQIPETPSSRHLISCCNSTIACHNLRADLTVFQCAPWVRYVRLSTPKQKLAPPDRRARQSWDRPRRTSTRTTSPGGHHRTSRTESKPSRNSRAGSRSPSGEELVAVNGFAGSRTPVYFERPNPGTPRLSASHRRTACE